MPKLAAIFALLLAPLVVFGVAPDKSQLESMYDKAFKAFDSGQYEESLKELDVIDKVQPDLAESLNLRGVVYMRQGKYPKAETAFRKALSIEPKFWNASFNLAEIPFLQKNWGEARNRFEGLIAGDSGGLQPETAQLIQYKILLTFVLQGKQNTVDWMVNKFEQAKDSPALYYANAAIAFQQGKKKEASEWLSAAEKQFPRDLNKLYAESFYEIGWMEKPAGESRPAIEISSNEERSERLKAEAQANVEKAERAFQQRDFDGALKLLDLADAATPNNAPSATLRGEILMEQGKLDDASKTFTKALKADPKFGEARYNLALIPFKQGDYQTARDRFEALFAETPGDEKNQAAQLLRYKIYLTLLMQGKDEQAQQLMDQFKFTGDTPALYYAHAAWEYKHGNQDQGNDWVRSARKIYSPALNVVFADSFYDLGWLKKSEATEVPPAAALAQANATPPNEGAPSMRLGQADSLPAPVISGQPTPSAEAAEIAAAEIAAGASPAPQVATANTKPATREGAETTQSAVTKQPAAKTAPAPAKAVEASAAPLLAKSGAPASNGSQPVHVGREQTDSWKPSFAEAIDRFSRPGTLFVGALLLAGILLLIGLVVQQARRNMAGVPIYPSSTPLTEPPFAGHGAHLREERHGPRDFTPTGPPKLSLHLKASEPAMGSTVFPTGPVTTRGVVPGVTKPIPSAPEEAKAPAIEPLAGPEPAAKTETVKPPAPAAPIIPEPPVIAEPAAAEPIIAATAPAEAASLEEKSETKEKDAAPDFVEAATAGAEEEAIAAAEPPVPAGEEVAAVSEEPITAPEEPIAAAQPAVPIEEELVPAIEEPVEQGAPVPELTTAFSPEPIIPELIEPEAETPLELIEAEADFATPIAGHRRPHSDIETPSFASKIISTEPVLLQPIAPIIMPETTYTPATVTPMRSPSPTMSVQQPAGGMHTAVQLTFSLEIASMQLTPTFKMSGLALKPMSRVVSMRLAPSNDPQPPMNLQVTFEVAKIDLANGSFGTVRLSPSVQEKPAVLTSPSFAITGLELVPGQGAAPVQITPSHQEQASVHLTAEFQIAAIEFTPLFEISTIVLNSTSRKVSMQLPGSGPTSIDNAPVFQIENVQLGPGNDLALVQVMPAMAGRA